MVPSRSETSIDAAHKSSGEAKSGGWDELPAEVLGTGQPHGVLSVILAFLQHPVMTVNRLTLDPSYRGHWSLMWMAMGANLTLIFVALPHLTNALFDLKAEENRGAIVVMQVIQYISIAILIPLLYFICRSIGSIQRKPISYVKFSVLSAGYYWMIAAFIVIFWWLAAALLIASDTHFGTSVVPVGRSLSIIVAMLTFVALSHRQFWGLTTAGTFLVTGSFAVLSWVIINPALALLAAKLFPGVLGQLF